jgi:hypothetical protein
VSRAHIDDVKQPLWRFVLHFMLLVFVVHRAAAAVMISLSDADPGVVVGLCLQCAAALVTSFAVLLAKSWEGYAVVTTAALVAATAFYGALGADVMSVMGALGQSLVAAIAAAGLVLLLRHEQRPADP